MQELEMKTEERELHVCEGVRVEGTKNVPCGSPATTTRTLNSSPDEGQAELRPAVLHYCDRCAADWDSQRELIANVLG